EVPRIALLFDSLGGAVSALDAGATAFPHRGAIASVQIYGGTNGEAADQADATNAVGQVRSALAARFGDNAYINYIDASMPGRASASHGDNVSRLQQVAASYDPDAFFAFAQSVSRRA